MKRGKYTKRTKRTPLWYKILLTLMVCVLAGCVWYLGDYYLGSQKHAEAYEDLAALVEANRPIDPEVTVSHEDDTAGTSDEGTEGAIPVTIPTQVEDQVNETGILPEYAPLHEMNPDMAGWIYIDGTKINYPVMQTPDRADYYLQRDFEGKYSAWGCIYAREECDLDEPSDNITLYGHNMKDGSMFAGLSAYTDREFWNEHRCIRFDTLKEHHTYAIFAVFTTTASEGEGFEYHEFIDAVDEMEFDAFIAKCLSLSLYGTDIVPEYGDKIICLSTCEYTQTNGRLVVAAVRID